MTTYNSVITGDLVSSVEVEPSQLMEMLKDMGQDLRDFLYPYDEPVFQFRGDGLQLMCQDPSMGITVMLLTKAWLVWHSHQYAGHTLDTRLYLGIGETILTKSLGSSGGEAFVLSGRGLDSLKAPMTMGISTYQGPEADLPLQHLVTLLDELSSRWKPVQGETMYYLLLGHNYTDIANMTGKSKSTVGESGRSLGWPRLEPTIRYLQTRLAQISHEL
jgi:hypothetical protein